jgi:hypothetical protein
MQHELGRRVEQMAPRDARVHSSWLYRVAPAEKALQINEFRVSTLPTLNIASIADGQAAV